MNPIAMMLSKSAGSLALKISFVAVAAIGGAGMVASNVFAALTATASNTSGGAITTGTLSLTLAPSSVSGNTGGFVTAINTMGPGDTVNRYIDLTNGGTLDGITPTLRISASPVTTLTSDATNGLQVVISNCTAAWSSTGTCSGTTSSVLSSTSANELVSAARSLSLPSTLAGSVSRLKVSITLPVNDEVTVNGVLPAGTVQGVSTALTWTFTMTERTGTTTNS